MTNFPCRSWWWMATVTILHAVTYGMGLEAAARAQTDQFGARSRAAAARQMIVLGVQQGISSLPPTSGQSFVYDFDPELGTSSAQEVLGPTSFRVPHSIGEGSLSIRLAGSYFQLEGSYGPALYSVLDRSGNLVGYTRFGLDAKARIGLFNLGATYGFAKGLDLMINVPVVVSSVAASQSFLVQRNELGTPLGQIAVAGVPPSLDPNTDIDQLLGCSQANCLRVRKASFGDLSRALQGNGYPGVTFPEGSNVGVGRIGLGGKYLFSADARFQFAGMVEFFAPSPNEAELAGSNSAAILPRLIMSSKLAERIRLHSDIGYDADFTVAELRRFVWNVGASVALTHVTFDAGFGGSKFDQGIRWTPRRAPYADRNGQQLGVIAAAEDPTLGTNLIDFLGGVKLKLGESLVLSGAVNVPINDEGFRAAAVGTGALEYYF